MKYSISIYSMLDRYILTQQYNKKKLQKKKKSLLSTPTCKSILLKAYQISN